MMFCRLRMRSGLPALCSGPPLSSTRSRGRPPPSFVDVVDGRTSNISDEIGDIEVVGRLQVGELFGSFQVWQKWWREPTNKYDYRVL
jgi:hypothetical protein